LGVAFVQNDFIKGTESKADDKASSGPKKSKTYGKENCVGCCTKNIGHIWFVLREQHPNYE